MNHSTTDHPTSSLPPRTRNRAFTLLLAASFAVAGASPALAVVSEGESILGTSDSFVVLAGAGVTNTGPTTLSGDLGTFPTTDVTGDASIVFASGVNHGGDAVTQGAKDDLVTGYNTIAAAGPAAAITDDLAGKVLTQGVYNSASSLGLSGELTLDAEGNPDAIFVFQAGSTLTTASASQITLVNGAQACNVFWQVGSSATLGTNSDFKGTVTALTSITAQTGAIIEGRVLARNGAVTLDTNVITAPSCTTPTSLTPTDDGTPPDEETPGETPTDEGTPSDGDTTVDEGTPTEDATTTDTTTDTPTSVDETPATPQVTSVPKGSVATGNGSTANQDLGLMSVLGVLGLFGASILASRKLHAN